MIVKLIKKHFLKLDGTKKMTGDLDMTYKKIKK